MLPPVVLERGAPAVAAVAPLRALAVTRGRTVSLPAEAGPLTSARGRGLLAHELTHVAQQEALGADVPAEDSPEGQALESEARSAEARAGGRAEPPELPAPLRAGTPPASASRQRTTGRSREARRPVHGPSDTGRGRQAQPAERAPAGPEPERWSAAREVAPEPQAPARLVDAPAARAPEAAPSRPVAAQAATTDTEPPAPAARSPRTQAAPGPHDPLEALALQRLVDQLYEPLRQRLRAELVRERERTGRLVDL